MRYRDDINLAQHEVCRAAEDKAHDSQRTNARSNLEKRILIILHTNPISYMIIIIQNLSKPIQKFICDMVESWYKFYFFAF